MKLSESSKECTSLTSQCEQSYQKVRELELELLKQAQARKRQSSLQEKLCQEKTRAAEAENRVSGLACFPPAVAGRTDLVRRVYLEGSAFM